MFCGAGVVCHVFEAGVVSCFVELAGGCVWLMVRYSKGRHNTLGRFCNLN